MANISNIKIGNTSYTVKDANAPQIYDLSAYVVSNGVLPSDYYKSVFHLSGEPVEMKYIKTNSNSTECTPLSTNTQYIVFAVNRNEDNGYYWSYYVFKNSDKKFVGLYNSTSESSKRPVILNKVFFNETTYSQITDTIDDYYNNKSFIKNIEFTKENDFNVLATITDCYLNKTIATFPNSAAYQPGLMSITQYQLLSTLAGVQSPIDITDNVKTWLSDNDNGKNTTSVITAGSVIDDIMADTNYDSFMQIKDYKTLCFTIESDTQLCNGTNNTKWTLYPGKYVCKQLDGYIPTQTSNDAYYTFTFVSNTVSQGNITVPKIATGFIHLVYKNTSSYVGWAIERIGKCVLSYLTT